MAGDHSRRRVWGQRPGQPDASPPSLAFDSSWRMDRPMDLRLQTRGGRIGDRLRQVAAHKLSGLERMEPALVRVEIEVISQKNSQRVEAVAATARKTYRAHADAREVESALGVLVCDDHALFRRGLQMVLDQEADLELVGEASDGVEVVEKAQELMPDVILMDVRMPKRSGIEAATAIKDVLPHVKILMLTISDAEADLYEAIKAGASGYLLKEIPIDEVADAIRSGWAGQSRISPSMASKLLTEFAAISKASEEKPQVPTPRLTDREMEVLRLVAQGMNNRDIAKTLFISENTVKNHIRNILEKLHLHSRMEAVVYAVREKMIEIS